MRWLLTLLISCSAGAQPDYQRLRDAKTPEEVVRIIESWERGSMGAHSVTFNNGMATTGSMVATFDRDTATYDYSPEVFEADAVASSADTARYGDTVAVYGARELETVSALTGAWRPVCAGKDSTGLPVLVALYNGDATWYVYRDGTNASVLNSKALYGGTNKPTGTVRDILAGETDEEADYCHGPVGGVCLPGIILVSCQTFKYDGVGSRTSAASYDIDGISLVYSTDNGATWELAWRTGTLNGATPPTGYLSEWSITATHLTRDGTQTEYWVTVCSYANGGDRGADTVVCKVSGGSGAWTVGNGKILEHTVRTGSTSTHAHVGMTFADPANSGGLKVIVEVGDSAPDNRTEEWLCSSASGYLTGGSAMSDAVNVVTGGDNWSGPVYINGNTGATSADQWNSSQTISYAPGPSGGWYGGTDEGCTGPVLYATVPTTNGARVNWRHAYSVQGTQHSKTGTNAYEFNLRCFTLNAWEYEDDNPAVAGFFSFGSGWPDPGYHDTGRIFYKPKDSETFGIVYAPQDEESIGAQLRPVLSPSGYIWIGTSNAHGLRRFLAPTHVASREHQAVSAGPGGNNEALATPVQVSAPNASNSVTIGTDTPPATPPTTAAAMHLTASNSSSVMGAFRITTDAIASDHSTLTIQLLVYTDTIAADSDADTFFRVRFYTTEGGTGTATNFIGPNRMERRGSFTLLTYVLTNGADAADDWNVTGVADGGDGLEIVMQIQMSTATAHPGEWWMWVAGVYEDADCPPSYFVPPATNGDSESLELSGFTCGSEWTAYAVGQLGGKTGRDCRHPGANTFREFLTLWEDADTYVEVAWDADDQIRIVTTDGASTDTETITGCPKFLRGDPFILALACDGTDYRYALSVAGTIVQSGTIASATAIVNPTKILLSQDDDGTVRETARWLYVGVHDSAACSLSGLESWVQSLRTPNGLSGSPQPAYLKFAWQRATDWRELKEQYALEGTGRIRYRVRTSASSDMSSPTEYVIPSVSDARSWASYPEGSSPFGDSFKLDPEEQFYLWGVANGATRYMQVRTEVLATDGTTLEASEWSEKVSATRDTGLDVEWMDDGIAVGTAGAPPIDDATLFLEAAVGGSNASDATDADDTLGINLSICTNDSYWEGMRALVDTAVAKARAQSSKLAILFRAVAGSYKHMTAASTSEEVFVLRGGRHPSSYDASFDSVGAGNSPAMLNPIQSWTHANALDAGTTKTRMLSVTEDLEEMNGVGIPIVAYLSLYGCEHIRKDGGSPSHAEVLRMHGLDRYLNLGWYIALDVAANAAYDDPELPDGTASQEQLVADALQWYGRRFYFERVSKTVNEWADLLGTYPKLGDIAGFSLALDDEGVDGVSENKTLGTPLDLRSHLNATETDPSDLAGSYRLILRVNPSFFADMAALAGDGAAQMEAAIDVAGDVLTSWKSGGTYKVVPTIGGYTLWPDIDGGQLWDLLVGTGGNNIAALIPPQRRAL